PALPPHLQAAAAGIRAALSAKPLEPPSRKELAPDLLRQQALRFLLDTGEAIELGDEVVMSMDAFVRATGTVKLFLREHGSSTARPASVQRVPVSLSLNGAVSGETSSA